MIMFIFIFISLKFLQWHNKRCIRIFNDFMRRLSFKQTTINISNYTLLMKKLQKDKVFSWFIDFISHVHVCFIYVYWCHPSIWRINQRMYFKGFSFQIYILYKQSKYCLVLGELIVFFSLCGIMSQRIVVNFCFLWFLTELDMKSNDDEISFYCYSSNLLNLWTYIVIKTNIHHCISKLSPTMLCWRNFWCLKIDEINLFSLHIGWYNKINQEWVKYKSK